MWSGHTSAWCTGLFPSLKNSFSFREKNRLVFCSKIRRWMIRSARKNMLYWWCSLLYPSKEFPGLPWWHSGWESACQCRGHRFEPWSGKIPHATEWLGPWATTTEPARLEPVPRNKRGRDGERPAHRDEEWPPRATTRESPRTETKTQHSHK